MPKPLNKAYVFRGTASILANDEWTPDNPMQGTLNLTATSSVELTDYTPAE